MPKHNNEISVLHIKPTHDFPVTLTFHSAIAKSRKEV